MSGRIDLTGKRFGRLVVVEYDHSNTYNASYWRCICDCGGEKIVRGTALTSGITTSCGCRQHEPKREDLTGERFGRLTVLEYDHNNPYRAPYWRCLCDCGNEIMVRGSELKSGNVKSCGCYHRDVMGEIHTTHGMSSTSLYRVWRHIKERCNNPNSQEYRNYGGRGIFICDEWYDFENFRDWALSNGYNPKLSIDRIDNNDGYYPENCRWADAITQGNNRRVNRYITCGDESHTIAEWARIFGISYDTLWTRIKRGNMRDFEEYFQED